MGSVTRSTVSQPWHLYTHDDGAPPRARGRRARLVLAGSCIQTACAQRKPQL